MNPLQLRLLVQDQVNKTSQHPQWAAPSGPGWLLTKKRGQEGEREEVGVPGGVEGEVGVPMIKMHFLYMYETVKKYIKDTLS